MNFDEARAEYNRLRQAYDSRQISAEDYGRRVQGLQVRDASGGYWAIDGNSGGWLRYDGSAWVPGQPPIPQGPPPGGFGAPTQIGASVPPQGGFGQAPQGGFGQTPAGGFGGGAQPGFGTPPQGGFGGAAVGTPPASAAPRRRNRGLLIGCGVLAVLLLACTGIGAVLLARSGGSGSFSFSTQSGLTEAATARSVTNNKRPDEKATEFSLNQEMYVTYTVRNAKQGETMVLRLFLNNAPVELTGTTTTFDKDATYYGYYSYTPSRAGAYRAELYYKGEATPSQTLNFTVR